MPTSSNRKAISATLLPPQALLHGQGIVRVEVLQELKKVIFKWGDLHFFGGAGSKRLVCAPPHAFLLFPCYFLPLWMGFDLEVA